MNAMTWSLAILSCFCQPMLVCNSKDAPESELLILEHYEGIWNSEFTIESQSEESVDKRFTGVVEAKWVLGGKFMKQTGSYKLEKNSPPFVIMTMMSFDKTRKRYQYDYFNSSGDIQRSTGKWDADAKTMTSSLNDDGKVTSIVADFSTVDVERWTIETKSQEGKVITRIRGTNTRGKEE